jgi:hypothetical protein
MADDRPENNNGKGGKAPGDQGHGRRGGRRRGFRGRHGGAREASGREGQGGNPREAAGPGEGQQGPGSQQAASFAPGREGQGAPREQRLPRPEDARDLPACPLCGKPVYDLSTALAASRELGDPAHFDCVLERVLASETLAAGEKIVYLGSGAFGVVEFKDRSESLFTVKRRIQWEKEGEKKDWRKSMSSRISNL